VFLPFLSMALLPKTFSPSFFDLLNGLVRDMRCARCRITVIGAGFSAIDMGPSLGFLQPRLSFPPSRYGDGLVLNVEFFRPTPLPFRKSSLPSILPFPGVDFTTQKSSFPPPPT